MGLLHSIAVGIRSRHSITTLFSINSTALAFMSLIALGGCSKQYSSTIAPSNLNYPALTARKTLQITPTVPTIGPKSVPTTEYAKESYSKVTYSLLNDATHTSTLPIGLTLDPDTGIISGTPTTSQTVTLYVVATNAGGSSAPAAAQIKVVDNAFTVSASGSNVSINTPSAVVINGATQSFTVTANPGYANSATVTGTCVSGSWSGSVYTTGAVTSDCSVIFSATQNVYTVTRTDVVGSTTTSSTQTVNYGATPSLDITPSTGYSLSSVTAVGCVGSSSGNTYQLSPVTSNCTVTVTSSLITYTVTALLGSGITSSSPTAQTVNYGATTSFSVTPSTGYTISASGCGGTLNGNTFTTGPITASCTVTFTSSPLTYIVSATGSGTTIPSPAVRTVNYGNTTTFTVSTSTGSTVSASGCGGSLNGNTYTTGIITGSCTVVFSSTLNSYTVNATGGTGLTITSPTSQTVNYGGTTSFTVSPNTGYNVTASGCGGTLNGNTFTTGTISTSCTVAFTATLIPYTVTATASTTPTLRTTGAIGVRITSATTQTVNYGGTTTFTISPTPGYSIAASGCGGTLSGNTYTTGTITGNCAVSIVATINTYTVTASVSGPAQVTPTTGTVDYGDTQTYTFTFSALGYGASSTVVATTGNCTTGGSWTGSNYTTGPITSNCSLSFSTQSTTSVFSETLDPPSNSEIPTTSGNNQYMNFGGACDAGYSIHVSTVCTSVGLSPNGVEACNGSTIANVPCTNGTWSMTQANGNPIWWTTLTNRTYENVSLIFSEVDGSGNAPSGLANYSMPTRTWLNLAQIMNPAGGKFSEGIAKDSNGNFYVVNAATNTVNVYNSNWQFQFQFGSSILNYPIGIAISSTNLLYVANTNDHQIEIFQTDGSHIGSFAHNSDLTALGNCGGANGQAIQTMPEGIAVDPTTNNIAYSITYDNNCGRSSSVYIYHYTNALDPTTYSLLHMLPVSNFADPSQLTYDASGNLYVINHGLQGNNPYINKVTATTNGGITTYSISNLVSFTFTYNATPTGSTSSNATGPTIYNHSGSYQSNFYASGIAADSNGNLYLSDSQANKIYTYDSAGNYVSTWGNGGGSSLGKMDGPSYLFITGNTLYESDQVVNRVQKWDIPTSTALISNVLQ